MTNITQFKVTSEISPSLTKLPNADVKLMPPPVPRPPTTQHAQQDVRSPQKFLSPPTVKNVLASPSTPDTPELQYPIRRSADSDSEDSPDVKKVPHWARSAPVLRLLKSQESADPDQIFPDCPRSCDLQEIFKKKKKEYRSRGSSGDWGKDRLVTQEEIEYKKMMGYI